MMEFEFHTVPSVLMEYGLSRRLGEVLAPRFAPGRLCLVTDRFLHRSGLLDPALTSLHEAGFAVQIIDEVVADPPEAVVLAAARRARAHRAELVLGLGGGSSMDVAKLIAVLAGSGQPLSDMYGVGRVRGPRLPLVQMPTTAGTGSEVTPIAIVTTGATTKAGVVSPRLYADLALLDAELTLGLPAEATAATGMDAMVHAIEAYTSRLRKNPVSDMLARQALELLSRNLLPACRDGADREAREGMLLGAMLAGQAFANAPVAAVHALAYPLGGIFHIAHGLSNALVLPHVLRFNLPETAPLYAELAGLVVPGCAGGVAARAEALIVGLEELAAQAGIPRSLRALEITREDLPRLAADAMGQTRLLVNNPRELNEADALAIYTRAWDYPI
ncbi:iron-containing alcohol dehydrogenase [Alkalilimnicola sp. S0819]|uniref:iron-containing alcohol dehydrogenase n=1 Tax=Alkalilimnicola sp. S0819 TaxID=2613922 RepID=UPI00126290FA|nr:iron-containing alcohol dehydrogenase [Alkalilimnicola sp. S0819]KAB7619680.1 iron-containing alcohol dehydrogenase [Alkalilimnicola sp. S0819]MPQ17536.1 iron-containing alcohol dehydrogenase [Alkalilimnicola sp. S0819]